MARLLQRLKTKLSGTGDDAPAPSESEVYATRLARRKQLIGVVARALPWIRYVEAQINPSSFSNDLSRAAMYLVGYLWMALIPFYQLSRRTWVDENALQPGQVGTTA